MLTCASVTQGPTPNEPVIDSGATVVEETPSTGPAGSRDPQQALLCTSVPSQAALLPADDLLEAATSAQGPRALRVVVQGAMVDARPGMRFLLPCVFAPKQGCTGHPCAIHRLVLRHMLRGASGSGGTPTLPRHHLLHQGNQSLSFQCYRRYAGPGCHPRVRRGLAAAISPTAAAAAASTGSWSRPCRHWLTHHTSHHSSRDPGRRHKRRRTTQRHSHGCGTWCAKPAAAGRQSQVSARSSGG